jgi:hypothetical protein
MNQLFHCPNLTLVLMVKMKELGGCKLQENIHFSAEPEGLPQISTGKLQPSERLSEGDSHENPYRLDAYGDRKSHIRWTKQRALSNK